MESVYYAGVRFDILVPFNFTLFLFPFSFALLDPNRRFLLLWLVYSCRTLRKFEDQWYSVRDLTHLLTVFACLSLMLLGGLVVRKFSAFFPVPYWAASLNSCVSTVELL